MQNVGREMIEEIVSSGRYCAHEAVAGTQVTDSSVLDQCIVREREKDLRGIEEVETGGLTSYCS